jgi:hypothetical protein
MMLRTVRETKGRKVVLMARVAVRVLVALNPSPHSRGTLTMYGYQSGMRLKGSGA